VRKLLGQNVVFIFMVVESEMALVKHLVDRKIESFGNVVYNCNFVICTIKYTHTCALGTRFKLVMIERGWWHLCSLSFYNVKIFMFMDGRMVTTTINIM